MKKIFLNFPPALWQEPRWPPVAEQGRRGPQHVSHEALASGFVTPPDSIQTSVYWYWISNNISKEGVIKDLESMKKAGINRAFIGNIGQDDVPYGNVKMLSEEWWDILHAALKKATEPGHRNRNL